MHIPNPLKLYDDFLLDYIFNPISWYLEWNLGKKPTFFALISFMVGAMILMVSAAVATPLELFDDFLMLAIVLMDYLGTRHLIRTFKRNTATGLNKLRTNLKLRVGQQLLIIGLFVFVGTFFSDVSIALMSLYVLALVFTEIIPAYFCSCDQMPPEYKQPAPQGV